MSSKYYRADRLFRELTDELQRLEHHEADKITGFDATDELTNIRAARDHVIDAREIFSLVSIQPGS